MGRVNMFQETIGISGENESKRIRERVVEKEAQKVRMFVCVLRMYQ